MNSVNPFTYGNPISDARRFFGRTRQVEQLFSRLRNVEFESSSLVGERRIGKTSLLYYIADPEVRRAHSLALDRYLFVYVDLALVDAMTTPARLWQYLLRQLARSLPDLELASFLTAQPDSNAIDNFALAELFDRIDAHGQHIILLLDEFENVTRNANFGADFFYSLRSLAIHHHLALVTSSRSELIELTHSAEIRSSPFFNIFANINLRLFDREEARAFIHGTLADTGFCFTESEVGQLLSIAGCHPFFLQMACHFMFAAYARQLDAAERADFWREAFRAEALRYLQDYWLHSTAEEKLMLAVLALLEHQGRAGQRSFKPDQLRNLAAHSERTLLHLETRSLVISWRETYTLFNSLYGDWIVQQFDDDSALVSAIQEALAKSGNLPDSTSIPSAAMVYPAGLTAREVQVLRLVATGLSDAQVAAQLVVSPRTVTTHLQSIYGKLGVNSRAAATRFAVEHGLL